MWYCRMLPMCFVNNFQANILVVGLPEFLSGSWLFGLKTKGDKGKRINMAAVDMNLNIYWNGFVLSTTSLFLGTKIVQCPLSFNDLAMADPINEAPKHYSGIKGTQLSCDEDIHYTWFTCQQPAGCVWCWAPVCRRRGPGWRGWSLFDHGNTDHDRVSTSSSIVSDTSS